MKIFKPKNSWNDTARMLYDMWAEEGLADIILPLKIGGLNGNECLLYPYEYLVTNNLSPTKRFNSMEDEGM